MNEQPNTFDTQFHALTGCPKPYSWQRRLYERMVEGRAFDALDIPTGLGKTSVIPIWLLACLMAEPATRPPMRLIYVVNRRTIVDQATNIAEDLAQKLAKDHTLKALWTQRFASGELAVSTLRGAKADDGDWLLAPHRPAVIIGTVDMIGSRLLFNGYRSGSWQRARHAGLLGQDSMIVHDESHLSAPFQKLLEWIESRQLPDRRLRILPMSATSSSDANRNVLRIDAEDRAIAKDRLEAGKWIHLSKPTGDLAKQLAELALAHDDKKARVIVFARTVDTARKVFQRLKAAPGVEAKNIELLTGTIRGHERDALIEKPVLKHLLTESQPDRTEYLVSTSAGEVGADFDADHLVCDLSTIDAMIQRFGRVNRRGGGERKARIDVVAIAPAQKPGKDGKPKVLSAGEKAWAATGQFLDALNSDKGETIDASPEATRAWRERPGYAAACEPKPETITPHDVTLDAWALTSIQEDWPLAHEVHPYLHGLDDPEPETYLAWRAELDVLTVATGNEGDREAITRVLKYYPLRPQELLRDNVDRIAELLGAARSRFGESPLALIYNRQVEVRRLSELPEDKKLLANQIRYRTIILPASVGGLADTGTIDVSMFGKPASDVADVQGSRRARMLLKCGEDGTCVARRIASEEREGAYGSYDKWTIARDEIGRSLAMRYVARVVLSEDEEGRANDILLLFVEPSAKRPGATQKVEVETHNDAVRRAVKRMGELFQSPSDVAALRIAAQSHDLGKGWQCGEGRWQRAIRNADGTRSLAKSLTAACDWKLLDGYRHEFGSLLAVIARGALDPIDDPDIRDLALHLVATHHGRGRPHFAVEAMKSKPEELPSALTPGEVARRFDRLQRRYGHWGLAYLESVLMAADAEASSEAGVDAAEDEKEDEEDQA